MLFSIIVCTHNRAALLAECLQSIAQAAPITHPFEVLVVDNASTDETRAITEKHMWALPMLRYVSEPQTGLSHARNSGAQEAKAEWLVYVDDDARVMPDYLLRTVQLITQHSFDAFGGRYLAWYKQPKPAWITDHFGSKPPIGEGIIALPANKYCSGGNFAVHKQALQAVGGFPVHLGMKGNQLGYGEEGWVQDQLRSKGFSIGFDNDLLIDHLVSPAKYTLGWHLRYEQAMGTMQARRRQEKNGFLTLIKGIVKTLFLAIAELPNLLVKKKYYWQNYLVAVCKPVLKAWGQCKA